MKFLIALLLLVSCEEAPKIDQTSILGGMEKEHYDSLSLKEKIMMKSCLNGDDHLGKRGMSYATCLQLHEFKEPCTYSGKESTGTSIVKTAVGTAIGYGAVKMLTGKKK